MHQTFKKLILLVPCICLVTILSGCTHIYDVPNINLSGISTSNSYPLTVELFITNDFANAKWEKHSMGDTFLIPLGESFVNNSTSIAQSLFKKVIVTKEGKGSSNAQADCTLTPQVVSIDQAEAGWATAKATITAIIEWTLTDKNGEIIWADTFEGQGKGTVGNAFSYERRLGERLTTLQETLFRNSYHAMASSPEIKAFAAKQ